MFAPTQRIDAVTELLLAEQETLRRLARRLARCEADADDLVQNTLLRAYRARDRFVPGTSIRAWLATILRRVFLTDFQRTKRRGLENDTDADDALERTPGGMQATKCEAPLSQAELLERLDDPVKRALERVPDVYRVPFLLSLVEDLTCAEIARRLRVPEGTVMSRIHRAREHMKRELVYPRGGKPTVAPRRAAGAARRAAAAA